MSPVEVLEVRDMNKHSERALVRVHDMIRGVFVDEYNLNIESEGSYFRNYAVGVSGIEKHCLVPLTP